jgi:hypothetical protein
MISRPPIPKKNIPRKRAYELTETEAATKVQLAWKRKTAKTTVRKLIKKNYRRVKDEATVYILQNYFECKV